MHSNILSDAAVLSVERLYPVSGFQNTASKLPFKTEYLTAQQFAAQIRDTKQVTRKEAAHLLTCATYCNGAKSRKIVDIKSVHAVYGDIDKAFKSELFEQGMHELGLAGVQVVAHQTYSHTAEAPRWRVYVLLDEPIAPSDYLSCWQGLDTIFGGMLDINAKDPSRLNYAPSCPPAETREVRTLNIERGAK